MFGEPLPRNIVQLSEEQEAEAQVLDDWHG
jgi:hypothetical protein